MDISKIDPRLASFSIEDAKIEWISAHDKRFSLHGVFYDEDNKLYMRVPDEVTKATGNKGLTTLTRHTSGGRLRFVTNSKFIAIKAAISAKKVMVHMSITGSHGFSVYADGTYRNRYSPVFDDYLNYKGRWGEGSIIFAEKKDIAETAENRVIDIYFPLYGGVCELYVGIEPSATLEKAPDYTIKKPFVFYGSSITQGACVSRPGNDYVSMSARRFDADYVNLGFSGNGNAEDAMVDYVNSFDASVFAFDYNMYSDRKDRILPPHFSIYERIREKHPDAVILLHDKPGCDYEPDKEREEIIRNTYEKALSMGDKKVCYISPWDFFGEGDRDCCMTDISHPNDLGAMRMANAVYNVLSKMI